MHHRLWNDLDFLFVYANVGKVDNIYHDDFDFRGLFLSAGEYVHLLCLCSAVYSAACSLHLLLLPLGLGCCHQVLWSIPIETKCFSKRWCDFWKATGTFRSDHIKLSLLQRFETKEHNVMYLSFFKLYKYWNRIQKILLTFSLYNSYSILSLCNI